VHAVFIGETLDSLEVEDGEESLLGGKRKAEGKHEKQPQQSSPNLMDSFKKSEETDGQAAHETPLFLLKGDERLDEWRCPSGRK
jgi:hypothetical protein